MAKGLWIVTLITAVLAAVLVLPDVSFSEEQLTFAMLPQIANAEVEKKWKPIAQYLEKATGVKIQMIYPMDFDEHIRLCREGNVQIAYSNPLAYVKMAPKKGLREHGHLAFALAKEKGESKYSGQFIVRVDNPRIKEFKDIKGKPGWIVGYSSAGGYMFEQDYALKNGIDLKKDCILTESPGNKQERVVMAVYEVETDFGCIRTGILDLMKDKIDMSKMRVLAETDKYPAWTLSAYETVKPDVLKKIQNAFVNIPADIIKEAGLPGGVNGFQEANDSDLDSMRELSLKLGQNY